MTHSSQPTGIRNGTGQTASLIRVAFVLLALVAYSPGPADATLEARGAADVVSIDVTVLSRDRRPVHGLSSANFTVTEDGRPRRIVAFAEVGVDSPATPEAVWLRGPNADVATNEFSAHAINVIVIDDSEGFPELITGKSAGQVARRIVDSLGARDLAAVVFTSGRDSGAFTTDRERLHRSIDTLRTEAVPGGLSRCPARVCVAKTLTRVTTLLGAASDRRKTVYFIGMDGAGGSDSPSLTTILRLAQWSNVTIHAIDPSGLVEMSRASSSTDSTGAMRALYERQDALRDLAEGSGGRAVINVNDPAGAVPGLFAEGESYYLIGFERVSEGDDGRVHAIDVSVNRSDVAVRARKGYYLPRAEESAAAAIGTAPNDLGSALLRPLPNPAVALSIAAAPFATADLRKATVALTVGVRHRVPGQKAAEEIKMVAAAFDQSGKTRGWRQEAMSFSAPVDSDGVVRYDVLSRLELEPGTYDVRVALTRAGDGAVGSVFTTVEIPDYAAEPLSMSGLAVESTDQPAVVTLATSVEDVLALLPTGLRTFRKAERARVMAQIYQGGETPVAVAVTARVVDAANVGRFEQSLSLAGETFHRGRSADSVFELPLETIGAGRYLLRVDARIDSGRQVSRELRFVVN